MLSRKDRLQIENICYANVLGRFSFFHNPKYRGPKFSWDWWVEDCVASTDDWVCTHYKHVGLEALELAERFTRSIAASSVLKMKE